MRCFVAVRIGAGMAEEIAAVVPALRSAAHECGVRVSWSSPESWHVTLKFLGEIDDTRSNAVRLRLRALPRREPFAVEATGLVALPGTARPPKVLAVRLSDDARFGALATAVDQALSAEGFAREERPFLPHVTLGRVRGPQGWRRFAGEIESRGRRSFGTDEVTSMALYRSLLGTGPARYEAIETFLFAAEASSSPEATAAKAKHGSEN